MTITLFIPVLIMLLGLLVYLAATNAKAQELGRLAFACGLLVSLFDLASRVLRLS